MTSGDVCPKQRHQFASWDTGTLSHIIHSAPSQLVLLGSGGESLTRCWDFGTRDMGRGHCPSAELGMASRRCRTVADWVIPVLFC